MAVTDKEQNFRLNMLNTFLRTPHRRKEQFREIHEEFLKQDPECYAHLAAWYYDNQDIRDHQELFAAYLISNNFDQRYREAGLALLRELPPYQVSRIVKDVKEKIGKVPTSLKTEVKRYLREREENRAWFDSSVLYGRKYLKHLYATFRIKPGGPKVKINYKGNDIETTYADAILFKGVYPDNSKLPVLRDIEHSNDEKEIAELIVKNNIPFRVVVGLVDEVTPMIMIAMLNNMSPQDVINHLGMLKRHGCMNNEKVKAIIMGKLEEAKKNDRVHTMKTKVAAEHSQADGEISQALSDVADTKIQQKGEITRPTAILVDASGSMQNAIEVGKNLASIASAIAKDDLYVYAFDEIARRVISQGTELSDWDNAFKSIKANGGTSIGCALNKLLKDEKYIENIVVITDEGENRSPYFTDVYEKYVNKMNVRPTVVILRVNARTDKFQRDCNNHGIETSVYDFDGDYYALQEVVPLLSRPSATDLLEEILEYPLPERKVA
jgi:hypothetical protein